MMTRNLAAGIALAALLLLGSIVVDPAPSSAPHPTIGPLGSVDVRPGPASPSTPASDTSDPKLSGAPLGTSRSNPMSLNALEASQLGAGDEDRVPASGAPQPTPALTRDLSAGLYQSAIGTALFQASATWCAPTPRQCLRWGGTALLAALPTYTGTPYVVRVTYGRRSVDVLVVSICGCGIDLSPYAFEKLAPLSRGRIAVEVEGPVPPLPATSTKGTP